MSVVQSFFLLFKSNAEDLIKGNKRAEESTKKLGESLKKTGEEAVGLGEQYTRIVETAGQAVAGFLSVGKLTSGIFNNVALNTSLGVQAKLIGQNATALQAYANAAEQAGGSQDGLRSFAQATFQKFAQLGIATPEIGSYLDTIRARVKQATRGITDPRQIAATQESIFQGFGVNQDLKPLLASSDAEYAKFKASGFVNAKNADPATKAAEEINTALKDDKQALNKVYDAIVIELTPTLLKLNEYVKQIIAYFGEHPKEAIAASVAGTIATTYAGGRILKGVLGGGKAAVADGATEAGNAGLLSTLGSKGLALGLISFGTYELQKASGDYFDQLSEEDAAKQKARVKSALPRLTGGKVSLKGASDEKPSLSELAYQKLLDANGGVDPTENIEKAKISLNAAQISQLGLGTGGGNSDRTLTVHIGDVHVTTNATNSKGIASDIAGDLTSQIYNAIANLDDAVNY